MTRRSVASAFVVALLLSGCDQLGNPPQYTTGPTSWKDQHGHLVTTTRSFKNEKTIRRVLEDGIEDLDYADPSLGPSEALTIVVVHPRALRPTRQRQRTLVTIFKLEGRRPITRKWNVPASSRRWTAAFSLPEPPLDAVSSVAP